MGGLIPSAAMSVLQLGVDAAQNKATKQQAQVEQAYSDTQAETTAQSQVDQLQQAQTTSSQQRQDDLRRALAAQRARFAARGLSIDGGSSAAALLGMQASADREDAAEQSQTGQKIQKINTDLELQKQKNLLDASSVSSRSSFSSVRQGLQSVSLLSNLF